MTDIPRATPDHVTGYVAAFAAVSWPLMRASLREIAESLGWTLRSEREKGLTYRSGLPFRLNRVDCFARGEEVNDIMIKLTDQLVGDDATLDELTTGFVATVADALGDATVQRTSPRSAMWDLPSGARVAIHKVDTSVVLSIISPLIAEVERAEERYGVDQEA